MKPTHWNVGTVCFLLLLTAPWAVIVWWPSPRQVVWECHILFENRAVSAAQTVTRSIGNYNQFFYANSTGFAQISVRNESVTPTDMTTVSNVHRMVTFDYGQAGPYLKKTMTHMLRKQGDTVPLDSDVNFVSELHEELYLQVFKLGPHTYALGRLGMPRHICQGRREWLTPRVR